MSARGIGSPSDFTQLVAAFRQALGELGFTEGQNVSIEFRWASGQYDRLPGLLNDLIQRRAAVIVAGGPPAAAAAKLATSTIPIVFVAGDAVAVGLVKSLNRPDGNLTGVSVFTTPAMWGKRLDFVRALLPKATNVAMLLSPNDPTEPDINELRSQAHALGLELFSVTAATVPEIDSAFANAVQQGANALLVSDKPFFTVRRELIVPLAARHALPAIYAWHDYVMAGGLMSYGSSLSDAWRQVGIYTARILKGAKPSDLPVQQPTKFYLAINLKTAKMLGLTVPPTLLTIADEVIE